MYQGEKIKCYTEEKKYLVDNAAHIIKSIVELTEEQYSNVYNEDYMRAVQDLKYVLFAQDDSLLFDICLFKIHLVGQILVQQLTIKPTDQVSSLPL